MNSEKPAEAPAPATKPVRILDASGGETILFTDWLKVQVPVINPEQIVALWVAEILMDRDDWTRETDHVVKLEKGYTEFLTYYQPGDALWFFSSPKGDWAHLAGRAGFVILREGRVITSRVTCMS